METSQFADSKPHFENLEKLNVGGVTCDTYRVKLYGKLHFLKQIKAEYAGDIRYQEALRKEFETGFVLDHPGLVRYISLDSQGILMDYVDGETLTQWLTTQPNYFKQQKNVDKFVRQLLDVISYLHSHQVLHLDIKPDNIMITHINHDVKLVDFDCCYTDTFTDTPGHTKAFAAPEQLNGAQVNVRTDIYAFGKILEQLPYYYKYNKVIARCTAQQLVDRYQSVDEILHDVRRRPPYLWIGLALILTILLLGGVLMKFLQPNPTIKTEPKVMYDTIIFIQKDTIVQPIVQPPTPVRKNPQVSMKDEMDRLVEKAFQSTIASFCDSMFPSPNPVTGISWAEASTDFHHKTVQIGNQLHEKYPNVPEATIHQEVESRFQSLVAYVFNKMRENGQ